MKNLWLECGVNDASRVEAFEMRFEKLDREAKAALSSIFERPDADCRDLIRGLGNPNLSEEYALALPRATEQVLKHTPNTMGLFAKMPAYRGPYATAWVVALANQGRGIADGIAYEVLATAQLMRESCDDLHIIPEDRIDFGYKLQAKYRGAEEELPGQPDRHTVEADIIIYRSGREIGVDYKHSHIGTRRIDQSQIDGTIKALETGEIHEFHFVANCKFDRPTREAIQKANEVLHAGGRSEIRLHENFDWR